MSESHPIRVFIAEDHAIVRKGVRSLLSLEADIEVVGEAANGREAVKGASELNPDVILMDLVMPELDGIQAIQQIKAKLPDGVDIADKQRTIWVLVRGEVSKRDALLDMEGVSIVEAGVYD